MKRVRDIKALVVLLFAACSTSVETKPKEETKPAVEEKQPTKEVGPAPAAPPVDMTKYPGTTEGAKALLTDVLTSQATALAITATLKPTKADVEALFIPEHVEAIIKYYEEREAKRTKPPMIDPEGAKRTTLLLFEATADQLNDKNRPVEEFPGGYEKLAGKFKPGFTWYRWKYVEPGQTLGMAYDGLVFVNGHWVWFPKAWGSVERLPQ